MVNTTQKQREAPAPRPSGGEVGEPSRSIGEPGEGASRLSLEQKLKAFARENRKTPTLAERKLWSRLRCQRNGVTFRRQHVIGNYIVDFFCSPAELVVEIDGASHDDAESYDTARTAWLEAEGFTVVRLWNMDVINDTDACATALFTLAEDLIDRLPFPRFGLAGSEKPPHPNPLPRSSPPEGRADRAA